jgi:hypothetical protein
MAIAQTNKLIETLIETVGKLREEQSTSTSQISEMYLLLTSLSAKLDILDQKSQDSPPAKSVGKKRNTKKSTTDEVETEVVEEPPKIIPKKRVPKKLSTSAVAAVTADEVDIDDTTVNSDVELPPAKPRGKKTVKTVVNDKPQREINIVQYFNQEYVKDPTTFDQYLTYDVKETIHDENAKDLDKLKGSELAKKKQGLYYHYMKDNHLSELQAMKRGHIENEKAKNIKLLESDDA